MSASIFSRTSSTIRRTKQCSPFSKPHSLKKSLKFPSRRDFTLNFNHTLRSTHSYPTIIRVSSSSCSSPSHESSEAESVVAEILQESGVPSEEAIGIASNCPRYVKMLMDSVRELDELSLWDSWKIEEEDASKLSFKKKIWYIAKEKKDNGVLAFLESIGLYPSSSTHIARYISSEKIVALIEKVKYVKQIFFSGSDQEMFIGKNARRMMMHLSVSTDDDIQRTLSFFEKMEARRGGLNMLGSKDACFPYLIEAFPRLLLRSVESHLNPLVEFLEAIGVPKACIHIIILCFPSLVFYDIETDLKPRLRFLRKVGIEDEEIGRMLLKYPWILSTSIQENYEKILAFFNMEKVPKTCVDCAIKSWPHLLGCSTGKMKLMVVKFGELGVTNKKMGRVIASSPQLLLRKPHEFLEVVSFLEESGVDEETIGRILSRCPEIFAASIKNTLKKKLEFLADLGISQEHCCRVIRKYPELLVSDVQNTLLPRMTYLIKVGFSKREVASMVHRFSPLLGYSVEQVLQPKLEFLINSMQKPIKDIVDYPRYFSYSLDKKIKPRFWVLKGRETHCSLKEMLGKNDEDFAAEFMGIGRMLVAPISDHLN